MATVEEIGRKVFGIGVSSTSRLDAFLDAAKGEPDAVFWPAFQDTWPSCDDTSSLQSVLLSELRARGRSHKHLAGTDLSFWNSLTDEITIYRGCDWSRRVGMSWTTELAVAESFAKGHRGIRNAFPVILRGKVRKASVLTVNTAREEHEILVKPRSVKAAGVKRLFRFEWETADPEPVFMVNGKPTAD